MGAAGDRGCEKVGRCLQGIGRQLGVEQGTGGGEEGGIGVWPALHEIGEQAGSGHRGGDTPLAEAGGGEEPGRGGGIGADIGQAIQGDTVLGGEAGGLLSLGEVAAGKGGELLPTAAGFAGAPAAPAQEEQISIGAQGKAALGLVHVHAGNGWGAL